MLIHGNAAWCWFGDPRAVYNPNNDCTYIGIVTEAGNIRIQVYNHTTDTMIATTLKSSFQVDDHANPSVEIRPDGRIVVWYSKHGGNGGKMYYRVSTNPNGVTVWNAEQEVPVNTSGTHGVTYPNPIHLAGEGASGKTFLFWRGGNYQPNFCTTSNWSTFTSARTLFTSGQERPYLKAVGNGNRTIHFAVNDGNPQDCDLNDKYPNNLYHFYYHEGAFYRSNGELIKDPSEVDTDPVKACQVTKVYDSLATGIKSWVQDIALNASGNPVIVYSTLEEDDHKYYRAEWNGTSWDTEFICDGGSSIATDNDVYSGGATVDPTDTDVVYTSNQTSGTGNGNGTWEIKKHVWGGSSWTTTDITPSATDQNVRPFVPRDHDQASGNPIPVIWMKGTYGTYTTYDTDLVSP